MKGDKVRLAGGTFVIQPSPDDMGIKTIHCQTKLMKGYASSYGDVRMADGTFKLSQYDSVFVIWTAIDCLYKSAFTGITCNFSENTESIRAGLSHFYPAEEQSIKTGPFADYFCPFQDSDVFIGKQSGSSEKVTFMSDQGSAFKEVAELEGWNHIYDRNHFLNEIPKHWGGLANPAQFRSEVFLILESTDEDVLQQRIDSALQKYCTPKASSLIQTISRDRHSLCFCHTGKHFTAGHVSDARAEGGMAAIKGRGTMKQFLAQSPFDVGFERILAVSRRRDLESRRELMELRISGHKVSRKYSKCLREAMADSSKFSFVHMITSSVFMVKTSSEFMVKVTNESAKCCHVNLNNTIMWKGQKFDGVITGTCLYWTSSYQICPCAIAAAARCGVNVTDIKCVHP